MAFNIFAEETEELGNSITLRISLSGAISPNPEKFKSEYAKIIDELLQESDNISDDEMLALLIKKACPEVIDRLAKNLNKLSD